LLVVNTALTSRKMGFCSLASVQFTFIVVIPNLIYYPLIPLYSLLNNYILVIIYGSAC